MAVAPGDEHENECQLTWRHRVAFESSPVGIALADEKGHFVSVNAALCELFGRPEADLLGRSSVDFTHADDLGQHRRAESAITLADDGVLRVEKRYLRPDGSVRWAWLTMRHLDGPNGEEWTLAHMQDVTDRKQAELRSPGLDTGLLVIARVMRRIQHGEDARASIVDALAELSGADEAFLIEEDIGHLVVTAATTQDRIGTRIGADSAASAVFRTGQPVFAASPQNHPLVSKELLRGSDHRSLLFTPILSRSDVSGVLVAAWRRPVDTPVDAAAHAVSLLADQAGVALTQAAMMAELEFLATSDVLTGLPNRRGWDLRGEALVQAAARGAESLLIALADLDHFKRYNDEHGHAAGDRLLADFAAAARTTLRGVDLIARWGGEEFAIALPGCAEYDSRNVLDRVRRCVPAGQTCSIGYLRWEPGMTLDDAVHGADRGLYAAKQSGRNRVLRA